MNTDKAYLFGLIVGGGQISDRSLTISLPYKQWGEVISNPARAGRIAKDILTKVQPIFRNEYGMDVFYKTEPNWRITTSEISDAIKKDLRKYGLPLSGDVRETADIENLVKNMNAGTKRAFIAGLADSIGSLAPTHRRFTDAYQIVSFEFKGKNFNLVASIVKTLVELGCVPDQILWNHPNQHSGTDRYYPNWRKGFKVRVMLDDYVANGSFLFQAKKEAALQNKELQKGRDLTGAGSRKRINVEGAKTIHKDENSNWLPGKIRGYHFIHNQHLAAALGCETIDKNELLEELKCAEKLINPFTILTKGPAEEIDDLIKQERILKNRRYKTKVLSVSALSDLSAIYEKDPNGLVFGETAQAGYPVNYLLQGIAYVICASSERGVKGKRVLGNFLDALKETKKEALQSLKIFVPDLLTPLVVTNGKYSAMVGPMNPSVYKKLIRWKSDILFKVRPIEEKDLL